AIAMAIAVAPAAAQPPVEGSPIVAIAVHGLRHIDESIVLRQMAPRVGTAFDRAVADGDVVRLDRLGVFSEIGITPVPVDGGVRLEVILVETLRVLPAISIAGSDANGASAGPTLKLLSVRGAPHEMSLTARFGGERLFQFSETSPAIVGERVGHHPRLRPRRPEVEGPVGTAATAPPRPAGATAPTTTTSVGCPPTRASAAATPSAGR